MYLVQLLLPLYDNDGRRLPPELFAAIRHELVDCFGGLTAYSRAPVSGLWEDDGQTVRDDLVIFEVMTDALDVGWWAGYRMDLERRFRQEELVIRSQEIRRL